MRVYTEAAAITERRFPPPWTAAMPLTQSQQLALSQGLRQLCHIRRHGRRGNHDVVEFCRTWSVTRDEARRVHPGVDHHQKYESDAALFVCYHAVTALTERFCQNAEIRPVRLAPSPSRRLRLTHGRARQEQLVGGQVGPASRKPCTQAPSFGPCLDVALRSLPPGTGFRCSSLLAHAILFLGLHDGIPAATSP
jgi:hypothetical protein